MERQEDKETRSHEGRPPLIGFLSVGPTQDQTGWIGAILVTDDRGYPLEFRCTTPVRPTTIQKALYGSLLKTYVSVELCGKRLLVELQRKPGLIVTPSSDLLALSGGDIPIVAVLPAGEAIETESLTKGIKRERLESASGQFQPVIILTQHAQQQEVDGVKVTLNDMFRNFNLLEPFERIRTALKALAESDPKYR